MNVETDSAVGLRDPQGVLALDHECRKCSYNLRGLHCDGRCPECGTPIGLSLQGDLLRFADPDWVDKVALGLKIILWMILFATVAAILGGALSHAVSPVLAPVIHFLASLISFYGVWFITEPDPSGIGEDPSITARKVIRVTLVVGLVSALLQIIAAAETFSGVVTFVLGGLILLAGIVALIGVFATFVYYEKLARRIPDDRLAVRARFLKWAYTIVLAVMAVAGGLMGLATAVGGSVGPGFGVLACLMLPVLLGLIVFGVMTIFMLLKLRRAVAEQARLARATWAAALNPSNPPP